jgi:hypothetical protein
MGSMNCKDSNVEIASVEVGSTFPKGGQMMEIPGLCEIPGIESNQMTEQIQALVRSYLERNPSKKSSAKRIKTSQGRFKGQVDEQDRPNGLGCVREGNGECKYHSGTVYCGNWKNDKKDGIGSIKNEEFCYEGNWMQDQPDGECEMKWQNGDEYVGENQMFKKNGKGKFRWADGNFYEGEFVDDEMHGFGKFEWKNGNVYEGNWKKGKMHGKGKLRYADGKVYDGYFSKGIKSGHGTMTFNDGRVYKGNFKQGKPDGEGVIQENGKEKKAFWKAGKFEKVVK